MSKRVLVAVADGSEEIETVTVVDVLRRAGAAVTMASVEERPEITASRGVRLVADALITECVGQAWDLIVLPGGMPGAERLRDSEPLARLLAAQKDASRPYAAICAAPAVVLEPQGLLSGHRATAYPSFRARIRSAEVEDAAVVTDQGVITSAGPGTAMAFALALVAELFGSERRDEIAAGLLASGW